MARAGKPTSSLPACIQESRKLCLSVWHECLATLASPVWRQESLAMLVSAYGHHVNVCLASVSQESLA